MERDFLKRKKDLIEESKESVDFFSGGNKWNREKWVVEKLLSSSGVRYNESELSECDEPVDVAFRDARFQIKEMMRFPDAKHRRRHDEYRSALQKAEAAETLEELASLTPYREVTWDQMVVESLLETNVCWTPRLQKIIATFDIPADQMGNYLPGSFDDNTPQLTNSGDRRNRDTDVPLTKGNSAPRNTKRETSVGTPRDRQTRCE